jgi:hypothetical protein
MKSKQRCLLWQGRTLIKRMKSHWSGGARNALADSSRQHARANRSESQCAIAWPANDARAAHSALMRDFKQTLSPSMDARESSSGLAIAGCAALTVSAPYAESLSITRVMVSVTSSPFQPAPLPIPLFQRRLSLTITRHDAAPG